MSMKPYGICWCDCHTPIDEHGKRKWGGFEPDTDHGWPRYTDPVAVAVACVRCEKDHTRFILTGQDPYSPRAGDTVFDD